VSFSGIFQNGWKMFAFRASASKKQQLQAGPGKLCEFWALIRG